MELVKDNAPQGKPFEKMSDLEEFGALVSEVKVDQSSIQHLLSRLTDLYANSLVASLRESISNAFDAIAMSGRDDGEIRIYLNEESGVVSIFDNGIGMSLDEIVENFVSYRRNEKADRLDTVGAYGIGAKAPLAYGETFSVMSVKDGKQSLVQMFRDSGVVKYAPISSEPTDRESGTTIYIPLQKSSFVYDYEEMCEYVKMVAHIDLSGMVKVFINGVEYVPNTRYVKFGEVPVGGLTLNAYAKVSTTDTYYEYSPAQFSLGEGSVSFWLGGALYQVFPYDDSQSGYSTVDDLDDVIYEVVPGLFNFPSSRDTIIRDEKLERVVREINIFRSGITPEYLYNFFTKHYPKTPTLNLIGVLSGVDVLPVLDWDEPDNLLVKIKGSQFEYSPDDEIFSLINEVLPFMTGEYHNRRFMESFCAVLDPGNMWGYTVQPRDRIVESRFKRLLRKTKTSAEDSGELVCFISGETQESGVKLKRALHHHTKEENILLFVLSEEVGDSRIVREISEAGGSFALFTPDEVSDMVKKYEEWNREERKKRPKKNTTLGNAKKREIYSTKISLRHPYDDKSLSWVIEKIESGIPVALRKEYVDNPHLSIIHAGVLTDEYVVIDIEHVKGDVANALMEYAHNMLILDSDCIPSFRNKAVKSLWGKIKKEGVCAPIVETPSVDLAKKVGLTLEDVLGAADGVAVDVYLGRFLTTSTSVVSRFEEGRKRYELPRGAKLTLAKALLRPKCLPMLIEFAKGEEFSYYEKALLLSKSLGADDFALAVDRRPRFFNDRERDSFLRLLDDFMVERIDELWSPVA